MNLDIFCQLWICVFGCSAVWFIGRLEAWRRWGYVLGLMSQPAWLYASIHHEQWGIALLSAWYTYSWGQGVYNYWIKERQK
jgi:hypothetical protein